jgi:histidinol dehydrogenase
MLRLVTGDPAFERKFARLVDDRRESGEDVSRLVADILSEVRQRGDEAVSEYTLRFDRHTLARDEDWRISPAECAAAYAGLDPALREALELAAERIRAYHLDQLPRDRGLHRRARDPPWREMARGRRGGLYVPGGRAAYPSSLLMNAIPAKVAGVERLVVATPTPRGEANPLVLAAAHLVGVDEVWRIGGAQAIAALAYGTDRIAAVDVITGPGNDYVAEAKRQLFGVVGIDMVAGPSEILVIADNKNDPDWIAADLLSQAEHDPASQSILITDDAKFADQVADASTCSARCSRPRDARGRAGTTTASSIVVSDLPKRPRSPTASPPSTSSSRSTIPRRCSPSCATPAACSSAATRPRRSATTSPGPTTCCRPAAARASPAGCRCSTS